MSPVVVRGLLRILAACEAAIPSDAGVERFVEKASPDAVLVSPLIQQNTQQTDVFKSARALGVPGVLCVASWDNLSSKGLVRIPPDVMTVWNETQRREAVEMHGVPASRISLTGAQQFDRWFGREPTSRREDLCRRLHVRPDRPYVLYVGQTRQDLDDAAEVKFVRQWIGALRSAPQPELRELAVLIRPHPSNARSWDKADLSELGDVAVWKRKNPLPVKTEDRADYFDALYYSAAVMGTNSSAMIEAAIIGRPVHTVALPRFHSSQRALLHYTYLLPENGGFLREALGFDEHRGAACQ